MDIDGEELINWYHKRCGKSEEAHSIMKEDLAGGNLPSGNFGEKQPGGGSWSLHSASCLHKGLGHGKILG